MAFRVMSFSVRMDTEKDGDNRWDCRKEVVANIIRSQHPLVFGLQEPHKHQVEWLAGQLPEYAWVGKGRCPVVFGIGEEHCEYNPVFYDTTQLECSSSGTMWLSDTPWLPNTKFAGSAFPRIATYARLKRKDDGREFTFVCTHFDHEGEEPRTRSAALLVAKLQELSGGTPVVLVGDLNAGSESEAYQTLAGALRDASCAEGCCAAEGLLPGGTSTFCGFHEDIDSVIDFIFVCPGFRVASFGVVGDKCDNGACPSDHKPIVADVELV